MLNEVSCIQVRPGDEYGKRAERVNVIKFILAIFGIRTNKKVRERRETNTM